MYATIVEGQKYWELKLRGHSGSFLDTSWKGKIKYEWLLKAWQDDPDFDDVWWCRTCLRQMKGKEGQRWVDQPAEDRIAKRQDRTAVVNLKRYRLWGAPKRHRRWVDGVEKGRTVKRQQCPIGVNRNRQNWRWTAWGGSGSRWAARDGSENV